MRPESLLRLLKSVEEQTLYPNEIIVVDGSLDAKTEVLLTKTHFKDLFYFKVGTNDRGLTKQRNYGINKVSENSEIICFLDDDIVLNLNYFKNLIASYYKQPSALAIGGYITNEVKWEVSDLLNTPSKFYAEGWMRAEPSRMKFRKKFGLLPDVPPGFLPTFSHARSIGFIPPTGEIYPVELIMGGVSSYKKEVFEVLQFSSYFEGYGLYEDADFSLRIAKKGNLYINTSAELQHYHDAEGRPNQYKYGKMVIRNGWYVWRVKYSKPNRKAKFKWHATAVLLTLIRFTNVFTTTQRKAAFQESLGRVVGWWSLIFNKPKVES